MIVLLEDACDPALRAQDGVVANDGAGDSDESDRCHRAFEKTVHHRQIGRLEFGVGRAEVVGSGAAAEIDRAASGVFEVAAADGDVLATAFGLHAVGRDRLLEMFEFACRNQAVVAADHVDAGAAFAPAFDLAIFDAEIAHAGKFNAVAD